MKKKIVLISEALGGGVRKHIIDILMNLDSEKFDIYFMYNLNRNDPIMEKSMDMLRDKGIKLIEIKKFNREVSIKDILALGQIFINLVKIKPDVVHCHSSKAGVLGRIASRIINVNQIYYTPHAYIFQNPNMNRIKKNMYIYIERFMSKYFTTKTINVSEGEKGSALLNNIDDKGKFVVIYNGIEVDVKYDKMYTRNIKSKLGIEDNDIVVGVTARLDAQKNPMMFMQVAEKILKKHNNVKFVYVGDGELRSKCEKYIHEKKLQEKVILTGFTSRISNMLEIFDIYFLTSLYEGMPYSLIEALRSRLPIVATNVIGNNEVVTNGTNGYMFTLNDIIECEKQLEKLILDSAKINSLGEEGYKLFINKFTLDEMIDRHELLYLKNCINRQKKHEISV